MLFFGRPGVAKGLEDVIQSIPHVVEHHADIHYVLIVPQDTKKQAGLIRSTIDQDDYAHILHKYAENITHIPGAKGDLLKQWIQTVDLVVLPSHAEGFGFAIAEVCAMHKPLITTNVASIPEVVSGEILFVEPGRPKHIAHTIKDYFSGSANVQHIPAKTFLWNDTIQKVLSIYTEL